MQTGSSWCSMASAVDAFPPKHSDLDAHICKIQLVISNAFFIQRNHLDRSLGLELTRFFKCTQDRKLRRGRCIVVLWWVSMSYKMPYLIRLLQFCPLVGDSVSYREDRRVSKICGQWYQRRPIDRQGRKKEILREPMALITWSCMYRRAVSVEWCLQ